MINNSELKISCAVRCLDPAVVQDAMQTLEPDKFVRVPYTCKLSGQEEELFFIGDVFASSLVEAAGEIGDTGDAKILAGLYATDLCECDVATLTSLPEYEVIQRLQALAGKGVLLHREINDMSYYHLESDVVRNKIRALIEQNA